MFTLRISGANVGLEEGGAGGTDERCEGSLNLVDLAGSERLNVSFANGAEKERVKETQAINKSLSALGDVIAALGERGAAGVAAAGDVGKHIPYRNSKVGFMFYVSGIGSEDFLQLTYLLQNSLSGNSKTLVWFLKFFCASRHSLAFPHLCRCSLTSLRLLHI